MSDKKEYFIELKTPEDREKLLELFRLILHPVVEFGSEKSTGVYVEFSDSDLEYLTNFHKMDVHK